MKITFAIVVRILSLGVVASFKNEDFCQSPARPVSQGLRIHKDFTGPVFTVDEPGGFYYGSKKEQKRPWETSEESEDEEPSYRHKTIVPERITSDEDELPYISESVNGQTLKHLKMVEFEPCQTALGRSSGIIVTAIFEKYKCDIIVRAKILPFHGEPHGAVTEYLRETNVQTGDLAKHSIKWIQDAFIHGGNSDSKLKNNRYWIQEYYATRQLVADQTLISNFLSRIGLRSESKKEKTCTPM